MPITARIRFSPLTQMLILSLQTRPRATGVMLSTAILLLGLLFIKMPVFFSP